jgi:hypothetical protein
MSTDRLLSRGKFVLIFAGRFCIPGAAVLLAAFLNNVAQAYPQGPESLDTGYYAADLPLPPTLTNATGIVEQFPGNLTGQLPSMSAGDSASDPFANQTDIGPTGHTGDGDWLVPYDGVHTNDTYSGDPLDPVLIDSVHMGFDLGAVDNPLWDEVQPSAQFFADSHGVPLLEFPALGAAPTPAVSPGGPFHYVVIHMQAALGGGSPAGEWFELPYTAGGPVPQITLTAGDQGMTLSNVGYFLSPTQIPLDNLNVQDYPAPGSPGTPFTSLPSYQGSTIDAGGNKTITLPEPGSLALVIVGGLIVAATGGYRRCRRAS